MVEIRAHRTEDIEGSLLLIGFPSRGLVGGVAATYVIDDLRMTHFASLYDPRLPPTMVVRDGVGHSPIQFFASDGRCGPKGDCDKLVLCQSGIPVEPRLLGEVAWSIVSWAKTQGVRHVVVLEGTEARGVRPGRGGSKNGARGTVVRGVRSVSSKHDLQTYDVQPLEEGLVTGYASAFLVAADDLEVDLVCLFIEARGEVPDARAATVLLRSVDAMLPHIDFRTKELEARAQKFETRMKTTLQHSRRQLDDMRRTLDMMYR